MVNLRQKYRLPSKVKVQVSKTPEDNFIATFPELPGCLTEADDVIDLLYQVNDAIFTYYDIAREDLEGIDFLYAPPPNFLNNIEAVKPLPRSRKSVEFHIPYATA